MRTPTDRQRPRVLMVLESCYPSPAGGGAEGQVRTLARALRARGIMSTVVVPRVPNGPRGRVDRVDRIPVCRIAYPRVPLLGALTLWMRFACFLLARGGRYGAYHVHIAHNLGAIASLIGRLNRCRVVVKVSGWWEIEHGILAARRGPARELAFRCLLLADAWQAISSRIAAMLLQRGIPWNTVFLVPNAVQDSRPQAVEPASRTKRRFLFVGRLVPEKGLDTLLQAFSIMRSSGAPDSELWLAGAGSAGAELQRKARELGLEADVTFLGHREDVAGLCAQADFAVLPSRIEGLSNSLLEGMVAALPVVATRVSGNEDLVAPGVTGWLCEPGNTDELAHCLEQAARMPEADRVEMGSRARAAVLAHAGIERVLDQLCGLYRDQPIPTARPWPVPTRQA